MTIQKVTCIPMLLAFLFISHSISIGNFSFFIADESPKTIFLEKGQGLMMVSWGLSYLKISIPDAFLSPRYIDYKNYLYSFFSFNNSAKIEMYFTTNISFYTINISYYSGQISNDCDFLYKNFQFKCERDFRPSAQTSLSLPLLNNYYYYDLRDKYRKQTNIAINRAFYGYSQQEIKNFCSQPPFSFEITSSPFLLSNATIEADFGHGKQKLDKYNATYQMLPFETKLYITYKKCESVLFKHYPKPNNPRNYTLMLSMNDIPNKCHSFSAFVSISSDMPWSARVKCQVSDEEASPKLFRHDSEIAISRNFPFNVTFYVMYRKCEIFAVAKTVTVDDPFSTVKINISNSDIPKICMSSLRDL